MTLGDSRLREGGPLGSRRTRVATAVRDGLQLAAARAGYRTTLLLLAGSLLLLTHLPGFMRPVWSPDEGFLGTQARVLLGGGDLYVDVVDRKPPVVPYVYAAVFQIFGSDSLWPVRLAAVGAHLVTALLLASEARRRWGDRAGLVAAALYAVASVGLAPEDSQAAGFEVFMLPTMVGAVVLANRGRVGPAGLVLAVSVLTKQTAGAALLPMLWVVARREGPGGVLRLLTTFTLPVLATAALFGWDQFWFWVATGSGGYLDAGGAFLQALGRGTGNLLIFTAGVLGAAILLPAAWRRRGPRHSDTDLWLWLLAAVVAVITGLRFFGHYFFHLTPPVVLLATGALVRARWEGLRRTAALTVASGIAFTALAFVWPTDTLDRNTRIADHVRAHTAADDRVLVWGMHPEIYWLADRRPASRYLTAGFVTGLSGGRPPERSGQAYAVPGAGATFAEELRTNPPTVVVDDSRRTPGLDRHGWLQERLAAQGYRVTAEVDGARVWSRPDRG